jgi:hypothetical protein
MRSLKLVLTVVALFCLLASNSAVYAQASLAAENQINDITIKVDGDIETYTVIRDGREEGQWYYVPNKPRLAKRKGMPVFHLLKFQAKNPENEQELIEGGILQFSVKLALPEGGIDQLKAAIAENLTKTGKKTDPAAVRVGPLPIKESQVTLYAPDGDMLTSEPQAPGVAPGFANQEIPFQIRFNKLGADVYDALVKGGGGLPVAVTFTYNGLTPPLGFKIKANWSQIFTHLSTDSKMQASFGNWAWGANVNASVSTCREQLTEKKAIEVSGISGEGFTDEQMDACMNPILEAIRKEMVDKMVPPDKVDPAVAKEPTPRKALFCSVGVSFSLKQKSVVKTGTEEWTYNRQSVIERRTSCGSVIGIGEYDDKTKAKLVTIMPPGNWASAYFSLPSVGDNPDLGIKQIDLQVIPVDGKGKQLKGAKAELAVWKADDGFWTNKKKEEISYLLFPMQGIYDVMKDKIKDCQYKMTLKITQNKNTLNMTFMQPMIDGDIPCSSPLDCVEAIIIDADWLEYAEKGDKEGIAGVSLKVGAQNPKKTYTLTVKGTTENKISAFLVESESTDKKNPISAQIELIKVGGKKTPWKYNKEKNLRAVFPGLDVMLWEEDFE